MELQSGVLWSRRHRNKTASEVSSFRFHGDVTALQEPDFTLPEPERYEARLIGGSVQVGDERAWHIEITPRDARTRRETGYTRMELWIGQRSLLALRTKAYTARNGVVKYVQTAGVRQVNGVWMPRRIVARTVRGETLVSETVLEQVQVNVGDAAVNASLFTPARLERGL